MQPEGRAPAGPRWLVRLWCPNCDWSGEALLDQSQVDRFDEEFDEGVGQLAEDLARITAANVQEYADRVAAALTSDAVLHVGGRRRMGGAASIPTSQSLSQGPLGVPLSPVTS